MDEQRRRNLRLLAGHPQPVLGGDRTVRLGNGLGEALDEIDRLRQENTRLRRELDDCTRSHQRLNAAYERAIGLLEEAERDFGYDVLTKIQGFLHER